jgi:hypothetical protein
MHQLLILFMVTSLVTMKLQKVECKNGEKADNRYYWPERETKKCEQVVNDLARHKIAYSNKLTYQLDNLRKK